MLSQIALLISSLTKYLNFVSLWPVVLRHHLRIHLLLRKHPDFSTFKPASESEISKILFIRPNKQCDSDSILTWLLTQCSALLVPTISIIVNLSLSNFHHTLKEYHVSSRNLPWQKRKCLTTTQFPTSVLYKKQNVSLSINNVETVYFI